jgi:hypothetical protein
MSIVDGTEKFNATSVVFLRALYILCYVMPHMMRHPVLIVWFPTYRMSMYGFLRIKPAGIWSGLIMS